MNRRIGIRHVLALLLLIVIVGGWCAVYVAGGLIGAAAWWLMIGFSVVGIAIGIVSVIILIRRIWLKRRVGRGWPLVLVLSLIAASPLGVLLGIWPAAYPADLASAKPAVSVRLPFREAAVTGWGGDDLKHNRHALWPMERWAYDFMMEPALTGSNRLEDYGIFGADVLAPVSGTIVGAYDGEEDQKPGTEDYQTMLGNYVYLKIDSTGTYLVMAHFKQGSLAVKEGQRVKEGDFLGQAGNSGASSEPHLHLHHQRQDPSKSSMFLTEGLPLYFRDVEGPSMPRGGVEVIGGQEVLSGDVLKPLDSSPK
ncbi:M23 family metallopeptidase [Paenibacillus sp. YPG26]|uniref:M23 family metallopeptidase n=1 Tax=Paenibacillus sp. YPG26 TaxID=2878915 RepID=UPI002042351F|nr:M23 family metallopeptidase [Paenibacillus sp. YPG26]USB32301.1 M23 family metallopeptidase [Paenibacillus sp. YPG26]